MYEGNGSWSIPLFGANEENEGRDFRGSTRMKPELEKGWFALDCGVFWRRAMERDKSGRVRRRIVHRTCTGNAERQGLEVRDQGPAVSYLLGLYALSRRAGAT